MNGININNKTMKEQELICTAGQWFTLDQAEKYFRTKVSVLNYEIVKDHLTIPELAKHIEGFLEQDGDLIFFTEDGEYKVKANLDSPRFCN